MQIRKNGDEIFMNFFSSETDLTDYQPNLAEMILRGWN